MTIFAIIAVAGCLFLLMVTGAAIRQIQTGRLLEAKRGQRIIVTLANGQTFDGRLSLYDEKAMLLTGVVMVGGTGDRVVVDGELVLFHSNIDHIQIP